MFSRSLLAFAAGGLVAVVCNQLLPCRLLVIACSGRAPCQSPSTRKTPAANERTTPATPSSTSLIPVARFHARLKPQCSKADPKSHPGPRRAASSCFRIWRQSEVERPRRDSAAAGKFASQGYLSVPWSDTQCIAINTTARARKKKGCSSTLPCWTLYKANLYMPLGIPTTHLDPFPSLNERASFPQRAS